MEAPMKYDATLKHLFERSARGLLRMLTGATVTEWLNVEMPKTNLPRLDLLGRLSSGGLCHYRISDDQRFADAGADGNVLPGCADST